MRSIRISSCFLRTFRIDVQVIRPMRIKFQFPSLDGRGKGRVNTTESPQFHPHLASPVKGEEQHRTCVIALKLMRMDVQVIRPFL